MRRLTEWSENTPLENWVILCCSIFLVLFAGLMSGLTLGLMSLDMTQMEVLKRSGTPSERMHAQKIMPVIQNSHFLLVTLLLCNAGAMETLPLFLDRLANPITAIILSATAVLFFGEIIPQSVCTRYGLVIGANLAWLVRILMVVCSPVAWPVGKLLDWLLGPEHHVLFRRQQLKALVDIHGEERGMGGKLSADETKVITGALDLTNKIAYRSMTPLDKVFMLSTDDVLNDRMLRAIVESGHSRVPIHRAGDKSDLVGLILVKELLQYKMSRDVPVCLLKMRSLPRLSADTRMYDMLKLFQTGRSHMAVLTQPMPIAPLEQADSTQPGPSSSAATAEEGDPSRPQPTLAKSTSMSATAKSTQPALTKSTSMSATADAHLPSASYAATASGVHGGVPAEAIPAGAGPHPAPSAPTLQEGMQAREGAAAGGPGRAQAAGSWQGPQGTAEESSTAERAPGTSPHFAGRDQDISAAPSTAQEQETEETTGLLSGAQPPPSGSDDQQQQQQKKGRKTGGFSRSTPFNPAQAAQRPVGRSATCPAPAHSVGSEHMEEGETDEDLDLDLDLEEEEAELEEEMKEKEGKEGRDFSRLSVVSLLQKKNKAKRSKAKELQARRLRRYKMVPQLAPPGQPIGIITIEDVIEELIRAEIVDETDRFVDNEHMVRVEQAMLESSLPERLRRVVTGNVGVMLRASFQKQNGGSSQQQQQQHHQYQQQHQQHGNSATTPLLGRQ